MVALCSLEKLVLNGCGAMSDRALCHISSISSLTSLCLLWSKFTDVGLHYLTQLRSLEELEISHCITIHSLQHISLMVSLRHLDLTGCYELDDLELASLGALGELRSLILKDCHFQDSCIANSQLAKLSCTIMY